MGDDQETMSIITQGKDYELLATPNQTSFVLHSKADFYTACLQGEDAVRFRTDYQTIQSQHPNWAPDQTLAQLWDQGGYSWLAAQDGD